MNTPCRQVLLFGIAKKSRARKICLRNRVQAQMLVLSMSTCFHPIAVRYLIKRFQGLQHMIEVCCTKRFVITYQCKQLKANTKLVNKSSNICSTLHLFTYHIHYKYVSWTNIKWIVISDDTYLQTTLIVVELFGAPRET